MYDAKSSFNLYLRNTVLPELPSGTYLYTSLNIVPSFPAVFVKYPFNEDSVVNGMESIRVQIECVSNSYNEREADILTDQLRDELKVKSGNGGTATNYNCNDPENLFVDGYIKWTLASKPKRIDDSNNPELIRNIFELNLEYVA